MLTCLPRPITLNYRLYLTHTSYGAELCWSSHSRHFGWRCYQPFSTVHRRRKPTTTDFLALSLAGRLAWRWSDVIPVIPVPLVAESWFVGRWLWKKECHRRTATTVAGFWLVHHCRGVWTWHYVIIPLHPPPLWSQCRNAAAAIVTVCRCAAVAWYIARCSL